MLVHTVGRCLSTTRPCVLTPLCRRYTQKPGDFRSTLMGFTGGSVDLAKDNTTGIATVKINHPERKNALSGSMMCNLADIASELEEWKEGKGVLLHGEGQTFCSGGDLNTMSGILPPDQGQKMSSFMHDVMYRFRHLPFLSLALVQGRALGGGAELTLMCDFRLFSPKAKLGFVQSRLGIVPGWGAGYRLVQTVGETKALELLATGSVITGQEAVDCKLAEGVTGSEEKAVDEARDWLKDRIIAPCRTIHAVKRMVINGSNMSDVKGVLDRDNKIFGSVWGGPDHIEALGKGIKHK